MLNFPLKTRVFVSPDTYLVEVSAHGHVVYKWYHRIFLETARSYFLSDKPFVDSLHVQMANYFLGRYDKEKTNTSMCLGMLRGFVWEKATFFPYKSRPATIHRCTGTSRYLLPRYEYRILNKLSRYLRYIYICINKHGKALSSISAHPPSTYARRFSEQTDEKDPC